MLIRGLVSKRAFDAVVGTILAVAIAPLVALLAVPTAIVLRANPLFVHERIGHRGRRFRFLKLRTLPPKTPAYADKYEVEQVPIPRWCRLLRRFHLDELPQLFHVPTGTMSLVGPRPEMDFLTERMPDRFARQRLSVRPGCTGLWQISGQCHRLILEAPEYDRFYLQNRCLRLDVWILWRSVLKVLHLGGPVDLADVPAWARCDGPTVTGAGRAEVDGPMVFRHPQQVVLSEDGEASCKSEH